MADGWNVMEPFFVNRKLLKQRALASGKHTKNYGKIHHFLMGKSTISTGPCSIAMLNYQRVSIDRTRDAKYEFSTLAPCHPACHSVVAQNLAQEMRQAPESPHKWTLIHCYPLVI